MRTKFKILSFILLSFLLISFDPIHFINFSNNTNANVKVKVFIKPEMENYDLNQASTGDSIVLIIKPIKNENDSERIEFGMGTWSDDNIDEVVSAIKKIEIETEDIKTTYKSTKAIKNLFETNREGFPFKTSIDIEIK